MTSRRLHLVVPGALDQATGGYRYDARVVDGLRELGWTVDVHELQGSFPDPGAAAEDRLDRALTGIADGSRVVIDGLALGALPGAVCGHRDRLRILALVHHPLANETGAARSTRERLRRLEREALVACRGVVVTSQHTAREIEGYGVLSEQIRTVPPGTDPAERAPEPDPDAPPRVLCVAAVTPRKGHDVLLRALARLADLKWSCVCVGSLERDPAYARRVQDDVAALGLGARVRFTGERSDGEVEELYRSASVFALASHHEGYGMALTEALARGLPVVTTTAGAIPDTVPVDAGVLVPPGDDRAFASALRSLLAPDPEGRSRREELAAAARRHAARLPDWRDCARAFAQALDELIPDAATKDGDAPSASDLGRAHSSFDVAWLSLREPVDRRSRAGSLLGLLQEAWVEREWRRVLDLGAGTGSNLRHLALHLPGHQAWVLLDRDASLLAAVRPPDPASVPEIGPEFRIRIRTVQGDLATDAAPAVARTDLVTASALLDLTSESWLAALVDACRASGCGAHFSLSYDGVFRWLSQSPDSLQSGDPDDAFVLRAVNAHQLREKGLGPALGPTATRMAERLFREAGYRTWMAPSPWRLGPADQPLVRALVDGWERAATEERPRDADRIQAWAARRRTLAADETLHVGHLDLLALPRTGWGSETGEARVR